MKVTASRSCHYLRAGTETATAEAERRLRWIWMPLCAVLSAFFFVFQFLVTAIGLIFCYRVGAQMQFAPRPIALNEIQINGS